MKKKMLSVAAACALLMSGGSALAAGNTGSTYMAGIALGFSGGTPPFVATGTGSTYAAATEAAIAQAKSAGVSACTNQELTVQIKNGQAIYQVSFMCG